MSPENFDVMDDTNPAAAGDCVPPRLVAVSVGRRVVRPKYHRANPISNTAADVNNISGKRSMSGYPQLIARSFMPPSCPPWNKKYAPGTATNKISGGWITAVNTPTCRTARTADRQPNA